MNPQVETLRALGQSLWYDNLERRLLRNGALEKLIRDGVITGLTSNPTIFEKAIGSSQDYDEALLGLVARGAGVDEIYLDLVVEDIRQAADLMRPVFEESGGSDGHVSLEVSPELAHDTEGTVRDALALWARVDRPNLMIKVPGTLAGVPAVRELIRRGLNVNVTLLFSQSQYQAVAEAYVDGLEARAAEGQSPAGVASVASFFVSRVDSLIDKQLLAAFPQEASGLMGKAAIANARLVYAFSHGLFSGPRWEALAAKGARLQRLLWASTGTKDPRYPDTLYVDELVGPDTVNTVPPATLQAFVDHGRPRPSLTEGLEEAAILVKQLEARGISLEEVGHRLQVDGVASFTASMRSLMDVIRVRREAALGR